MANNRQQASIIVDGLRDAGFCITRVSVLSYDANPPQDSIPAGRVGGSPGEARGSGTDREPENGERRSFGGNSLTRPDSGAFLATGPMFAPLRGATAGAVEHRLIDLGFEACEAGRQVDRIKAGDILFSFQADTAAARDIKEILRVAGVPDLCPRSESPSPRAATARKFHVEP